MLTFCEYITESHYEQGFKNKPNVVQLHKQLKKKGFAYKGKSEDWHMWEHPEKGTFRYSPKFGYEHRHGKKLQGSGYPMLTHRYADSL